ncbi:MAG: dihydrofolate reductase [Pseudobdellovibrionaceae bacterium]
MSVSLIVAVSANDVIGRDNDLIWHIPADLKHFKEVTSGKTCIMGRKTFESILAFLGKPLPNRHTVIVSRSGYAYEGTDTCPSLEEAIHFARKNCEGEIMITGGAQIYREALDKNLVTRAYITRVEKSYEGDAFFAFDGKGWELTADLPQETEPPCRFQIWEKAS